MCIRNMNFESFRWKLACEAALAMCVLLVVCVSPALSQTSATKTFSSAEEAANALFQAAQNGDEQQLEAILGTGKEVNSSGDEVEDKLEREQFTRKYEEMHRLVEEANHRTVLYIGAENWPFPIPVVSTGGTWRFDSDAGKREIMFREIGENEATAIQVCDAFATARKNGAAAIATDNPVVEIAQSLISLSSKDPWNEAPFHGYYFRGQKGDASVALIAYPVTYRSSGVMTFLLMPDGTVYERDLGPKTAALARKLHKPDAAWRQVD